MTEPTEGVRCVGCGRTEPEPPMTWTAQTGERGRTWLCERCTRDNVRSMEAKLDEAWW